MSKSWVFCWGISPPRRRAGFRPVGRVPFPRGKGTKRRWGTPQRRTSFDMSACPQTPALRGPPIRPHGPLSQRRGWISRHTAPRLSLPLRRRKVRLSPFPPDGENCARFLAPPLQRKPTSLGFALGAAFGGLYKRAGHSPFGKRLCCGGAQVVRWRTAGG